MSRPVRGATQQDYTTAYLTETIQYWARGTNPHDAVDSPTATITVNPLTPGPQPSPAPEPTPQPGT